MVGREEIGRGLRELGLEAGQGVMVHSSLSSFGRVAGGADDVIEALKDVLTPAGTLLLPSFNHVAPFAPGGAGIYDPAETPTSNGAIPDRFWRLPGVWRSWQPTHPFAAWGANARRYTEFHHRALTVGPNSPLGQLWSDGGQVLLLGVDCRANTFHHTAEMRIGAPCLGRRTEAYPMRLPTGRRVTGRTWGWRAKGCPLTARGRYEPELWARGAVRETLIGDCRALLFSMDDCFAVLADVLTRGRDGFPPCAECPVRPRRVATTVESDWDEERQCLRPDSESLTY